MSINAVKGVEIGEGFKRGPPDGRGECRRDAHGHEGKPVFLSNHAGGILGGISTGQPVVARFAVKPTSSILTPRRSIDRDGKDVDVMTKGRHDPCVGIRAVPIGEAMVACAIADIISDIAARPAASSLSRGIAVAYDQKKIVEAIRAFERGEIVVVTDDDGRENEGDLIVAAVHCTPEKMAFIVRYTSGIVCTPMPREEAKRLGLGPMVAENESAHTTAFTVSIDYRHGTTTGISADDRTLTVRNLANPNAGAADFVRPGHIFPLVARERRRPHALGHTEAAVDLCRLAELPPIGVICELVNDDGTVTRGPQVTAFAEKHGLKQVSVADLIAYRQRKETLVEQVAEFMVDTPAGKAVAHSYTLPWDPMHHSPWSSATSATGGDSVRLHPEDVVTDVFGAGQKLDGIMKTMAERRRGVIVYLREGSVGVAHTARNRPAHGDAETHEEARRRESEWREIGLGAQILRHLGISSIELFASRERHYVGLEGFGIRIVRTEIV